jgi:hypothetical protein
MCGRASHPFYQGPNPILDGKKFDEYGRAAVGVHNASCRTYFRRRPIAMI